MSEVLTECILTDIHMMMAQLQEEDGGQFILRNERIQTVYSYSLFHVTLCLANMYFTFTVFLKFS